MRIQIRLSFGGGLHIHADLESVFSYADPDSYRSDKSLDEP
jgi:hypothetical protein